MERGLDHDPPERTRRVGVGMNVLFAELVARVTATGAPIISVRLLTEVPPVAEIQFDPSATPAQQAAATAVLTAFDWSAGALVTVTRDQQRAQAAALLADPQGNFKLVRGVVLALLDEINILRAAMPRPVQSITRIGAVATVTTVDPHGLTTGDIVRITGATLAAYNLLAPITVTSAVAFTYAVAGAPATPAVGSISVTVGSLPLLGPRTAAQARTAILNKLSVGTADT